MIGLSSQLRRLERLERLERLRPPRPAPSPEDLARFDWYAPGCPCGAVAGGCREHPRARASQCPPAGDWRTWVFMGGRGAGKTQAAVKWLVDRVERGVCRRGMAIGATVADVRDVLVEGPSGILASSPPWNRPRHEPSKRRVSWPNGATVVLLSGEEPARARGQNVDTLLADELPHWKRARETFDLAMLALRIGPDPRCMIATTPRLSDVLARILGERSTVTTRATTFENAPNLAPEFVEQITALYQGTRFGRQEIGGELIELAEGAWFHTFDRSSHVSEAAEFDPGLGPVVVGIDAGTSRTTAAVFLQAARADAYRQRFTAFGDYLATDTYSGENARAILQRLGELAPGATILQAWIDPASAARTSIGPSAMIEYERVFGRALVPAPSYNVADGLDVISGLLERGDLVVHPRAETLIAGFNGYMRAERGGRWLDVPKADQSPIEDPIDALRYAIVGSWPEGRKLRPPLRPVDVRMLF